MKIQTIKTKYFQKVLIIAANKISDKYKKTRNKNNVSVVEEIQEVASKKSVLKLPLKKSAVNTK